jgi:hypothetical protein
MVFAQVCKHLSAPLINEVSMVAEFCKHHKSIDLGTWPNDAIVNLGIKATTETVNS